MPFTISGQGTLISLRKMITAKSTKPKISMESNICDFKRKVITGGEKIYPMVMETIITNMDSKDLKWWFDLEKVKSNIDNNIFDIIPSSGILSSFDSKQVKIHFNPIDPKE